MEKNKEYFQSVNESKIQTTSAITTPQSSWNLISFYSEQTEHCINILTIVACGTNKDFFLQFHDKKEQIVMLFFICSIT